LMSQKSVVPKITEATLVYLVPSLENGSFLNRKLKTTSLLSG
jgi:hypothetical protein